MALLTPTQSLMLRQLEPRLFSARTAAVIAALIFAVLLLFQSVALLWCFMAAERGFVLDRQNSAQIFEVKSEKCAELQTELNQTAVKIADLALGFWVGKSIGR